ncbi:SGNH/GDSL hydrolase family protein [Arthrobacter sp. H14-L1]|uniref:SGNH/GDSL hydrolase family protein n=1 Tax=Arthrobacter sp. H14-L1 TaxID=2996697 RepID=UPI00226FC302|nr:SGNH/GDSL hydrolase family protein [Arthrobacter sp. H14-L1]MCY0903435.1 SGNH/GDSL hydrolase family protein [Arthrobacter sp. H14-L1]
MTSNVPATAAGPTTGPAGLPAGTLYLNPATGRKERVVAAIARTAVLIGDSQSEGAAGVSTKDTWTNTALAKLGYNVVFCGRGGTGFVTANGPIGNYPDALEKGNWNVPYGPAPLVVIEGGGNDAGRGATDDQIVANASRLVKDLRQTYPTARFVMIGTLAKGPKYGGGRRTQVDSLLRAFAEKNSIPFISAGDWLTAYSLTDKMADGVHLTGAGHRILSDVLVHRLTALGVAAP